MQIPEMLKLCKALRKEVLRLKPDLIWTNNPKALFFLYISGISRRYPVVFYARGWGQKHQISRFKRLIINMTADNVFTVSGATGRSVEQWYKRKENINVVYNTVDIDKIIESAEKPLVDFVLWLAGDLGTLDGKNKYYEYLTELVEQNNLSENVVFLGFRTDIPGLTKLADIVVLPTHTEGLPRAVFESMFLNTPVIATPAGGVTDLIKDGRTGLITPFENPDVLAENIEKLYNDESLKQKIIGQASDHVNNLLHPDIQIPLICEAIENVI